MRNATPDRASESAAAAVQCSVRASRHNVTLGPLEYFSMVGIDLATVTCGSSSMYGPSRLPTDSKGHFMVMGPITKWAGAVHTATWIWTARGQLYSEAV